MLVFSTLAVYCTFGLNATLNLSVI